MQTSIRILLVVSIAISLPCSASSNEIELSCTRVMDWNTEFIGSLLTCFGIERNSLLSTKPGLHVSSVVQPYDPKWPNISEIKALMIGRSTRATLKFIPTGIKSQLTNLKALAIQDSGLRIVVKENLKEFGNSLEMVSFMGNLITFIPADLFDYNPKLRGIFLQDNPIRYIEPAFFTKLKNLRRIDMVRISNSSCIDQDFKTSEDHDIETFSWNYGKCKDESAKIESLKLLETDETRFSSKINTRIDGLEKLVQNNTKLLELLRHRVSMMQTNLENLSEDIKQVVV